ncbi:MAG: hypothetical protein P8Z80_14705 [Pseudolabrys sp.]
MSDVRRQLRRPEHMSAVRDFGQRQLRARSFFDSKRLRLPSITGHHFLWACAVMPFFVLPPLVAVVSATIGLRRSGRIEDRSANEWIVIIALINIILSALILYRFHFSPVQLIEWLAAGANGAVAAIHQFLGGNAVDPRVLKI